MKSTNPKAPNDFSTAVALLRDLIAQRKLLKNTLEDETVTAAFAQTAKMINQGSDADRLEAVSILGKAAEISKPVATFVYPALETGLANPMPHIGNWGTADERYYLAKGIATTRQSWIPSYAAIELARAEAAERSSRRIWAELAILRSSTLANAVSLISKALEEDQTASGYASDTALRKLNRVATAIADFLPTADLPVGEGFGAAFADLVADIGGTNDIESRTLRTEAAENLLDLMIAILRFRFTCTLDPDIYRTIRRITSWWKPASPPDVITSRNQRIAQIAVESLHTLSRQGVIQRPLRDALVASFGADLINRLGADTAIGDPSLDPSIASWLSGRELRETRSNPAVRELNERELDELVGRLLISVYTAEGTSQSLEVIADDIELLEPRHSGILRSSATHAKTTAQWAQAIAAKRRLILSGERGDVVEYNPSLHQGSEEIPLLARVRIKTPSVLKQSEGRPAELILKAEIEQA